MQPPFPTNYEDILARIDGVDPVQYGKTRNYTDGAVTYLSPYISRGVISTRQVLNHVLGKGYAMSAIKTFIMELCWRDYFQRVAQIRDVNKDLKQSQPSVKNQGIPTSVITAATGIDVIDQSIQELYQHGYMHNHCRMYTASLVCNMAKSHWYHPAQWMYYYLLDGDWASNACSWQWVAGSNSHKKYMANQENMNRYAHSYQSGSFMDKTYEELETMDVPESLRDIQTFHAVVDLPFSSDIQMNHQLPLFIYNYYNLDPLWHKGEEGNRILLLEPSVFAQYPIGKRCMDFMLNLSRNIPGIQIYIGSFQSLCEHYSGEKIYFKEHPLNLGYSGLEESRDWISEQVKGYYPSFFAYWKKIEKEMTINSYS